ncbi:hypothetical protein POM88_047934 [Heracleum sosnowskyi]|uniref:Phorbol-ester/DAG-type domain-containing protein n=1 Tax=Heracleum sosnowskyi TaxID=360622 RepID=A0AAD8M038_9APIA|nr:hypothetical protein POM88_047934 [Heracleum sosnowskyi]
MEFVKHKHPLILDENVPGGYQACYLCREPLHSPLIYSVYRCSSRSDSRGIADDDDDCVKLFLHKSCAELPLKVTDYFMHPQHPISLIPIESTNTSWTCSICLVHSSAMHHMSPTQWLYYCGSCRFFVHITCVDRPTRVSRPPKKTMRNEPVDTSNFDIDALFKQPGIVDRIGWDPEFPLYLPVPDESLLKFWRQQFLKMSRNQGSIYKEMIQHWSHRPHLLFLKKQHFTANDTRLTTTSWRYIVYNDDKIMLCDGCTYPIYPSISPYYECSQCKYYLHATCSEFREPKIFYGQADDILKKSADCLFNCRGCGFLRSGIALIDEDFLLDIGCASLPSFIMHEAHEHDLFQFGCDEFGEICQACGISSENKFMYRCMVSGCRFNLHNTCALKPRKLEHRWDPHPLTLITKPENVSDDHPHDYNCEHCSIDIDTNCWFYHCSLCDLSCHIDCIDEFYKKSNIKFGESDIKTDQQLHEHGLKLVLNKRKRCCGCCGGQIYDAPILECRPCNFIICMPCVNRDRSDRLPDPGDKMVGPRDYANLDCDK